MILSANLFLIILFWNQPFDQAKVTGYEQISPRAQLALSRQLHRDKISEEVSVYRAGDDFFVLYGNNLRRWQSTADTFQPWLPLTPEQHIPAVMPNLLNHLTRWEGPLPRAQNRIGSSDRKSVAMVLLQEEAATTYLFQPRQTTAIKGLDSLDMTRQVNTDMVLELAGDNEALTIRQIGDKYLLMTDRRLQLTDGQGDWITLGELPREETPARQNFMDDLVQRLKTKQRASLADWEGFFSGADLIGEKALLAVLYHEDSEGDESTYTLYFPDHSGNMRIENFPDFRKKWRAELQHLSPKLFAGKTLTLFTKTIEGNRWLVIWDGEQLHAIQRGTSVLVTWGPIFLAPREREATLDKLIEMLPKTGDNIQLVSPGQPDIGDKGAVFKIQGEQTHTLLGEDDGEMVSLQILGIENLSPPLTQQIVREFNRFNEPIYLDLTEGFPFVKVKASLWLFHEDRFHRLTDHLPEIIESSLNPAFEEMRRHIVDKLDDGEPPKIDFISTQTTTGLLRLHYEKDGDIQVLFPAPQSRPNRPLRLSIAGDLNSPNQNTFFDQVREALADHAPTDQQDGLVAVIHYEDQIHPILHSGEHIFGRRQLGDPLEPVLKTGVLNIAILESFLADLIARNPDGDFLTPKLDDIQLTSDPDRLIVKYPGMDHHLAWWLVDQTFVHHARIQNLTDCLRTSAPADGEPLMRGILDQARDQGTQTLYLSDSVIFLLAEKKLSQWENGAFVDKADHVSNQVAPSTFALFLKHLATSKAVVTYRENAYRQDDQLSMILASWSAEETTLFATIEGQDRGPLRITGEAELDRNKWKALLTNRESNYERYDIFSIAGRPFVEAHHANGHDLLASWEDLFVRWGPMPEADGGTTALPLTNESFLSFLSEASQRYELAKVSPLYRKNIESIEDKALLVPFDEATWTLIAPGLKKPLELKVTDELRGDSWDKLYLALSDYFKNESSQPLTLLAQEPEGGDRLLALSEDHKLYALEQDTIKLWGKEVVGQGPAFKPFLELACKKAIEQEQRPLFTQFFRCAYQNSHAMGAIFGSDLTYSVTIDNTELTKVPTKIAHYLDDDQFVIDILEALSQNANVFFDHYQNDKYLLRDRTLILKRGKQNYPISESIEESELENALKKAKAAASATRQFFESTVTQVIDRGKVWQVNQYGYAWDDGRQLYVDIGTHQYGGSLQRLRDEAPAFMKNNVWTCRNDPPDVLLRRMVKALLTQENIDSKDPEDPCFRNWNFKTVVRP